LKQLHTNIAPQRLRQRHYPKVEGWEKCRLAPNDPHPKANGWSRTIDTVVDQGQAFSASMGFAPARTNCLQERYFNATIEKTLSE
jgi:hypothetical protein